MYYKSDQRNQLEKITNKTFYYEPSPIFAAGYINSKKM